MPDLAALLPERAWVIYSYFQTGGPIMWPLLAVSVWLWTLIVVKLLEIRSFRRNLCAALPLDASMETKPSEGAEECCIQSLLIRRKAQLNRHVGTILVLASVAPLIGLLGTVSGMIDTFEVIHRHGAAQAQGLAAGISEALLTTQGGLMVALPGLCMGNFIRRRTQRLGDNLDRLGLARISETNGGEAAGPRPAA